MMNSARSLLVRSVVFAILAVSALVSTASPDAATNERLLDDAIGKYLNDAVSGDPHAQYQLGSAYRRMDRLDKLRQAESWLTKAAEQKFSPAYFSLGILYTFGPLRSDSKAVTWLIQGAREEHAGSQWLLASAYELGRGVAVDHRTALDLYAKSARQGHAAAQAALGRMHLEGIGAPRQYDVAIKWLRKAATQGHSDALDLLGQCHERGRGTSRNLVSAYVLYSLALSSGSEGASESLARVEEKLDPAVITAAQRAAASWVPGRPLPLPTNSTRATEPAKREQQRRGSALTT
jgi:uncharacterized protein